MYASLLPENVLKEPLYLANGGQGLDPDPSFHHCGCYGCAQPSLETVAKSDSIVFLARLSRRKWLQSHSSRGSFLYLSQWLRAADPMGVRPLHRAVERRVALGQELLLHASWCLGRKKGPELMRGSAAPWEK